MSLPLPPKAWDHLPFWGKDWPALWDRLQAEERPWLPGPDRLFAALDILPPEQVRVVILGQDPYPNASHAMGLAFSVPPELRPLPRSLNNIHKELLADLGQTRENGDLSAWCRQGVLLLNPVLTVPEGESHGHKSLGWQVLTRQILAHVAQKPTAFVLWGKPAQAFAQPLLEQDHHLIVASAHPSPLSASRGFFGSKPFSRINAWLKDNGQSAIDWSR